MNTSEKTVIEIRALINATAEIIWKKWTEPADIINWNHASDDWCTRWAENDLQPGGKFLSRMEAKDGSFGFDFGGIYDEIKINELIAYTLGDGRKVKINFIPSSGSTTVIETFEAESSNSIELQQKGWQLILNNFKKYVEEGQ